LFTGIVIGTGRIRSIIKAGKSAYLAIDAGKIARGLKVGDSVSINGVCLTVVAKRGQNFEVQAVEETLEKTNLGDLRGGDRANLELPLRPTDRLGGHFVLGHVDTVGRIQSIRRLRKSWMFRIRYPEKFRRYLVPTGSIAIDGVSLTIARLRGQSIEIAIIPHTMQATNFKIRKPGDKVNLEFDVIGKFVDSILQAKNKKFLSRGI
jgi:riboflavin synthase